jgi:hypothetical protein
MSKQESSEIKKNLTLADKWASEDQLSRTLGYKARWQEFPCIIGHTKEYALIAFSETEGKIVDVDGNTVEEGDPRIIWENNRVGQDFGDLDWLKVFRKEDSPYPFWKAKYPELLPRG